MRDYWLYIMTNSSRTLYTGVTNDLERRVAEHRLGEVGYTARYRIKRLVYYEHTNDIKAAIAREKQIKAWTRAKRIALITSMNPAWDELLPAADPVQIPRSARDDNGADPSLRSG